MSREYGEQLPNEHDGEEQGQCETYFDIAVREGLKGRTAERYILYMHKRWGVPEDERIKCLVGYASEWTGRFARGDEYGRSDCEGQRVLKEIDNG